MYGLEKQLAALRSFSVTVLFVLVSLETCKSLTSDTQSKVENIQSTPHQPKKDLLFDISTYWWISTGQHSTAVHKSSYKNSK